MTALYKLVNAVEKVDEEKAKELAKNNPQLLEEKIASYSYNPPVCIAADKGMYQSCGGYSTNRSIHYLLRKVQYKLVLDIAKLEPKLVNSQMIYYCC